MNRARARRINPHARVAPVTRVAIASFPFFHRDVSNAMDLLVYFQGGGACWEWVSCSGLFDSEVSPDEPQRYRGIFDRANPANPFREFAIVFVPDCTGDVHIGGAIRRRPPLADPAPRDGRPTTPSVQTRTSTRVS